YRLYRGRWPDPLYRSSLHGCPDSAPRCFYLGRGQWRDPVPPGTGPVSGEALCPLAGPGGSLSYRR
ncbi:hypothetical protein MCGFDL_MCGFDL_14890, partial [Dysosmobacter welbionis]